MRRIGFKRKKGRIDYKLMLIIFSLIFIPIASIIIGSKITEKMVIPVLYPDFELEENIIDDLLDLEEETLADDEKGDEKENMDTQNNIMEPNYSKETVQDSIQPVSIYMIQIASLSDIGNIENLVEELNGKGLSHLIYKMDKSYKVYVLAFTNKNFLEDQLSNIKIHYPDAYISEINLPKRIINYSQENAQETAKVIKDLNSLIEIMDKQSKEWYNFIEKEGELTPYKELLIEQQAIITQLLEKHNYHDLPEKMPKWEAIEKMILHHEKNIKSSIEIIEGGEGFHKIHSLYLDNLFRTLETIK